MYGMLRGTKDMQIMVTDYSDKLGIDNNKLSLSEFKNKLNEECKEVMEEIDTLKLAYELLDVIQIAVGMLFMLVDKQGLNLKLAIQKHFKKLRGRGWRFKKMITFQILDWRE